MNYLKALSLAILTTAILFGSCRKKDDDPIDPSTGTTLAQDQALIQSFFEDNQPAVENFTVDAAIGTVYMTSDGTIVTILPNAFVDASGNPITGNVEVSVKEYNEASEMILANKPTITATGGILESRGEFMVTAQVGSTPILADSGAINILVPDSSGQIVDMLGWIGDTTMYSTISGYNHLNTLITGTYPAYINPGIVWSMAPIVNTTSTGYQLAIDTLGQWVNIDVLYNDPNPKTTLLCYMDQYNDSTGFGTGVQPSNLFFKPNNLNSVIKLSTPIFQPDPGFEGFLSYQNLIPIGMVGSFIAITSKDGKLYAELKTNTTVPAPATGNNYSTLNFTMTEVTESELLNLIQSIN